jgi:hypothetical protein
MAIHGKVGSADPSDRSTWPHHVSRCAFFKWLTCGPLWRFQVYGPVWGGLLMLWALESLCWTCGDVWFVRRCFSWIDEVSWTHVICVEAHRHVAWCGSHRAHDIVRSYLVHISFIRAPKYTNDISVSIVLTSPSQCCSADRHLGQFMMMPHSCHWCTCSQLYHFMCILACPASKARNTNTCGNFQYKALS